jgi:hypothetical protein
VRRGTPLPLGPLESGLSGAFPFKVLSRW